MYSIHPTPYTQAKSASAAGDDSNAKLRMWLAWGLIALAVITFLAILGVIIGVEASGSEETSTTSRS